MTKVFFRGDITQPRQDVAPSDLSILAATTTVPVGIPANDKAITTTGRRLAWAKKLTDGKHPLVARVIVNRTWMHHFGQGLAATPGDFGALGSAPRTRCCSTGSLRNSCETAGISRNCTGC